MEYIIDHTNTPWLDDDMSDPFMKAMVPSLVDYVLSTSLVSIDEGGNEVVGDTSDCIWHRFGSSLLRC
jgi:hypothetical protein